MEKRVLISRWLGSGFEPIPIYDEASVSSARQRVRETAERSHLSRELAETVALIASELTHNHLRHAKHGYFGVRPVDRDGMKGLEIIAADLGPAIERPAAALHGHKNKVSGSIGAGLAAVCRLADEVDWDNRISEGACIVARKFEEAGDAALRFCETAIMSKPFPGEPLSGDDAIVLQSGKGFLAAVADGLGHGVEAREASNRAMEIAARNTHADLGQIAVIMNSELNGTRGCAISLIRFDRSGNTLEFLSAGDVHAHLYHLRDAHFFTPTPMVLGTNQLRPQKIRLETITVVPHSVLVIFTDGLKSKTTLKGELEILRQPAIAIAQNLLENHSRPDDDALVCAIKFVR